jgi:plastocyanin
MFPARLVLVSATLMVANACAGGYSSSSMSPSPMTSPAAMAGGGSSVTIPMNAATLRNRAYTPDDLNVAVGATVTWMNTDAESHTSTSDANGWDSGIVAPGRQFSFTFQTAGTFRYHCAIHPDMVGTVVVR